MLILKCLSIVRIQLGQCKIRKFKICLCSRSKYFKWTFLQEKYLNCNNHLTQTLSLKNWRELNIYPLAHKQYYFSIFEQNVTEAEDSICHKYLQILTDTKLSNKLKITSFVF